MTDYNDGNWHGWDGGECPVHPETLLDITFPSGDGLGNMRAADVSWDCPFLFRIVKEYREPREFWLVGHMIFFAPERAKEWNALFPQYNYEIIHVVEKPE